MAFNWRSVDEVTLSYCKNVARLLKERHAELMKSGGLPLQHHNVTEVAEVLIGLGSSKKQLSEPRSLNLKEEAEDVIAKIQSRRKNYKEITTRRWEEYPVGVPLSQRTATSEILEESSKDIEINKDVGERQIPLPPPKGASKQPVASTDEKNDGVDDDLSTETESQMPTTEKKLGNYQQKSKQTIHDNDSSGDGMRILACTKQHVCDSTETPSDNCMSVRKFTEQQRINKHIGGGGDGGFAVDDGKKDKSNSSPFTFQMAEEDSEELCSRCQIWKKSAGS